MSADELVSQALALSEKERAYVAEKLLESLDEENFEISDEWKAEIERRCREVDEGKVETIPLEQVMEEVREDLKRINEAC